MTTENVDGNSLEKNPDPNPAKNSADLDTPALPQDELTALAESIKSAHADTKSLFSAAVCSAYSAGEKLTAAKRLVRAKYGHGHWLTWLKENVGIPDRTAQSYMALYGYINEMEDMRDKVAGYSFNRALAALADEWEARNNKRAKNLVEIEQRLHDIIREQQELFKTARTLVASEDVWAGWLDSVNLKAEQIETFLDGTFYMAHNKKHPPIDLLTLPEGGWKNWLSGHRKRTAAEGVRDEFNAPDPAPTIEDGGPEADDDPTDQNRHGIADLDPEADDQNRNTVADERQAASSVDDSPGEVIDSGDVAEVETKTAPTAEGEDEPHGA